MGDSDTENEAFVQNVMHELSAFDVESQDKASREKPHMETTGKDQDKTPLDKDTKTDEQAGVSPKQPSRIIRLSRPAKPFASRNLPSVPQNTTASSSSVISSSSTTTVTSSSSLRTSSSPAPGSRLAALNRPGSPMHKILQRAQSPALAAAARMSRQATDTSGSSEIPKSTTKSSEPNQIAGSVSAPEYTEVSTQPVFNRATVDGTPESDASGNQSKSILPPRIQSSSSMAGSILLRRPQSPLHSGKSQLLIHKQISVEISSPSPNSPLSATSPRSPNVDNQDSSNQSASAADAEKAAIRNKLRANSFRLKDLLTQRPFTKRKETLEGTSKDDSSTSKVEMGTDQDSKNEGDEKSGVSADIKSGTTSRSRWRTEASSLSVTGTKSTISERTASLISARSFRNRSNLEATELINESSASNTGKSEPINSDESHRASTMTSTGVPETITIKNNVTNSAKDNMSKMDPIVSVGATLLRSPRTRITNPKSNVPSNRQESSEFQSDTVLPLDRVEQKSDVSEAENYRKIDPDNDKRVQAISDLEKDNEANLIFNSEKIGHSENDLLSPGEELMSNENKTMSQSLYTGSVSKMRDPSLLNPGSVPSTPVSSTLSMRTSKSYDNTPDADFLNSSAALKRSFAVTDLDKAMRDRDQQKLNLIFKDENKSAVDGDAPKTQGKRHKFLFCFL